MAGRTSITTDDSARVLLISGSTRAQSVNTAVIRTIARVAPEGVRTSRYGLTALPHFNPDDDRDPLPPTASKRNREAAAAPAQF